MQRFTKRIKLGGTIQVIASPNLKNINLTPKDRSTILYNNPKYTPNTMIATATKNLTASLKNVSRFGLGNKAFLNT